MAIKTVQESSTSFRVMGPCQTHLIVTTWDTERQKGARICKTPVRHTRKKTLAADMCNRCSSRDACTRRDQDIPVCQNSPSSAFMNPTNSTPLEVLKNRTAGRGTNSMPTTPWSIGLFNQGQKPLDQSYRKKHTEIHNKTLVPEFGI